MKKLKIMILALIASSSVFFVYQTSFAVNDDDLVTIKGMFTDLNRPVITMKSDDGTEYRVHIGPYWYWDENKYSLELNTSSEVYGKLETGKNEIYAYTVLQDGNTIKLTDNNGNPLWWNRQNNSRGWRDGCGNRNGKRDGTGPKNGTGRCWRR